MSGPDAPDPPAGGDAPGPWSDPDPGRPLPLLASLAEDVRAHVPPDRRPRSRLAWAATGAGVALRSSGFRVVLAYRLGHTLRGRLGPPGRVLAALVFWLVRHLYGCSIAPTARLHGGLSLPHPQGLVIGGRAEVGPRAWIFQNVTIGGAPGRRGQPRVGSDARIYAGAVLAGAITLGDRVAVGANAVVTRDVPSDCSVRCAPAEVRPATRDPAGPPAPEAPAA